MKQELETIKVLPSTKQALKIIAALTGEKHYEVAERVSAKELKRIKK